MITTWYLQSQRTWDKLCHSCRGSSFLPRGAFPEGRAYAVPQRLHAGSLEALRVSRPEAVVLATTFPGNPINQSTYLTSRQTRLVASAGGSHRQALEISHAASDHKSQSYAIMGCPPPLPASCSSPSHPDRSCWISPRCSRSRRSTSSTLGWSFFRFHGGRNHHSVSPRDSSRNCNTCSRLSVTPCAWLVRTIGFLVHARHSSHPSRCFRSRNPSSCRNRAANNSTICNPVRPTADVTRVNRLR